MCCRHAILYPFPMLYPHRFEASTGSGSESEMDTEGEIKSTMKAVTCIGRQPNSDVFVLGPDLHFTSDGKHIEKENQEFKYIPLLLKQLGALKSSSAIQSLPECSAEKDALQQVVEGMQRIGGENAMCGLFCLGA